MQTLPHQTTITYQLQGYSVPLHHITVFRIFILPRGKLQNSYFFNHYRLMSDPLSIAVSVAGLIALAEVIAVTGYEYVNAFERPKQRSESWLMKSQPCSVYSTVYILSQSDSKARILTLRWKLTISDLVMCSSRGFKASLSRPSLCLLRGL